MRVGVALLGADRPERCPDEAASAAPTNPGTRDDAAALAQAWTLIAQGSFAAASTQAQDLLRNNPRSVNALGLAVDAAIGLQGSTAGLDQYEHWLGARTLEEPGVLRRLARAFLEEWARQSGTRLAALTALAGAATRAPPRRSPQRRGRAGRPT